jgi:YjbE family integral membrane protein
MTFFVSLLKIMMINVVLSGDNAVVIALASRNLPSKQRWFAILGGSGGAIVLRLILTIFAVIVLKVPYLQIIGGVFLIWIAVKLLTEEDGDEGVHAHENLWAAIRTIIIADIVMSLDNTLAIAAAAHGDIMLLSFGLVFSIPLIIFGSQIIMKVMEKFPIIVYIGAALIAWTSGEMIAGDHHVESVIPASLDHAIPFTIMGLVVAIGWFYNRRTLRVAEVSTEDTEKRSN